MGKFRSGFLGNFSTMTYSSAGKPVVLNSQTSRINRSVSEVALFQSLLPNARQGILREYVPGGWRMKRFGLLSSFGLIVLMIVSVQTVAVTAQPTTSTPVWAKTYHVAGAAETANSARQTADGGYIVAGTTNSSGAPGNPHAWILKLDTVGNVVWQKIYGGVGPDGASSVDQTTDGGYIVAGSFMNSTAGQPSPWVFKLDPTGNIVWQKTFSAGNDAFRSITHTSDGGSAVAGWGTFYLMSGGQHQGAWVVRLDTVGNIIWQQVYSTEWNYAYSIGLTSDGGFVVAGRAHQITDFSSWDPLIFKIDPQGNLVWQKIFHGFYWEEVYSALQTFDGGFIVAGFTSTWGDQHTCFPSPGINCQVHDWVFKLDSTGNMVWQKTYGGSANENLNSIAQTNDGGYVVVGPTNSPGGAWIYKLDPAGNILWQDGGLSSATSSVQKTSDGGIVAAGYSSAGISVAKLDANGAISPGCNLVGSANFTATNTNATDTGRTLTVGIPFVSVFVSNATATDTSALTSVQCASNEPPDFTMTANPSSLTVKQSGSATTTITINSTNGFTGTITLNASIAPGGNKAPFLTLSSTTVTVAPGAPATVLVTVSSKGSTPLGSYTVKVTGSSGGLSTTITIPVQVVKKK